MSILVRPAEALRQQVIQMQREAAENIAKKGIKLVKAAGAPPPPPPGPDNKNNLKLLKKFLANFDLSCNKITAENVNKNINRFY